MSGWDPEAVYQTALRDGRRMSGNYNHNLRVETAEGPVVVRLPAQQVDQMDLRIWDEPAVLTAVTRHVRCVPRVLHICADPPFQIHEFVPGPRLDDVAPRGMPVPVTVVPAVLRLFARLSRVGVADLPALPARWPSTSEQFGRRVCAATQQVFDAHRERYGGLLAALGVPADPLRVVRDWTMCGSRPFQLLHADVHRKNVLVGPSGPVFLDWELALWGDPLYDLAVHITKMAYLDQELSALLAGWEANATSAAHRGWRDDLRRYLRHERVKAAVVHSVRYAKEIEAGPSLAKRRELVSKLTRDLNSAGRLWGWDWPRTEREVGLTIAEWLRRTRLTS